MRLAEYSDNELIEEIKHRGLKIEQATQYRCKHCGKTQYGITVWKPSECIVKNGHEFEHKEIIKIGGVVFDL